MENVNAVEMVENNSEVQSNKAEWSAPKLVVMTVEMTMKVSSGAYDGCTYSAS